MTQQEFENKIKKLQDELDQLKAAKIEVEQPKRWKPDKEHPQYYYVYSGSVCCHRWDNTGLDDWQDLIGNCFETEEEALEHKKQIEYTARYKNYIEEHSESIDCKNINQSKYFADFNCESYEIEVSRYSRYKQQGTIYASSEQIIWDAIKEIGEDNFKKYVLGVK